MKIFLQQSIVAVLHFIRAPVPSLHNQLELAKLLSVLVVAADMGVSDSNFPETVCTPRRPAHLPEMAAVIVRYCESEEVVEMRAVECLDLAATTRHSSDDFDDFVR